MRVPGSASDAIAAPKKTTANAGPHRAEDHSRRRAQSHPMIEAACLDSRGRMHARGQDAMARRLRFTTGI
jgi:hypothetical protein